MKKVGKKQDRYGIENLHSEIAEEDLNKFIGSPALKP